jgi:hypothetical protein
LLRHLHRRIFFLNFFCYEVIVKQKFNQRFRLYYYKQTRESTALSVAYNVERWRRVGGDRGTSSARRNVDVSVQLVAKERMRPVAGLRTLGGRNYHKR